MSNLPDATRFYIDGEWIAPSGSSRLAVIDPATEAPVGEIALADNNDIDQAIAAARRAFQSFSQTSVEQRLDWLRAINEQLIERNSEIADAISAEMGAPRCWRVVRVGLRDWMSATMCGQQCLVT